MEIKENLYVRLWDYANKESLEYKIVAQSMKTHYIGGDVYAGHYFMKSEQELASGGNGFETISLKSKLGESLQGKSVGQKVSYVRDDGVRESFRIIGVSEDGIKWEESPIEFKGLSDKSVVESNKETHSNTTVNSKRLEVINSFRTQSENTSGDTEKLFNELRELRMQFAREEHVPAFMIFHDRALREMCKNLPVNKSQLLSVRGVGEAKLDKYGDRIVELINEYVNSAEIEKVEAKPTQIKQFKKCFRCNFDTDEPKYNFCPICGNKLDEQ